MAGLDGKRVIKIQCGVQCSAILTDDGVYAMGRNLFGKQYEKRNTPTKIDLPNVMDISLKAGHILAKTTSQQVFAWGMNGKGQCGVGANTHVEKPTRVPIPDGVVVDIEAGWEHSIFTCKKLEK